MTRKVGRPRKKYGPGERLTIVSVAIPEAISNAIPSTSNVSREFTTYLQLRLGGRGKEEIDLENIRGEIRELESRLSVLRAQEEMIIDRQKKQDHERMMLLFQQNALSNFLKVRISNIAVNRSRYDADQEVRDLERNAGIIMSKASLVDAIRHWDSLPDGNQLLIQLGVKLAPGCQSRLWWKTIMEEYQKLLDSRKGGQNEV